MFLLICINKFYNRSNTGRTKINIFKISIYFKINIFSIVVTLNTYAIFSKGLRNRNLTAIAINEEFFFI
nr:MAG TPA: hypothetical protein [Caudoviricetes sp.]